MNLAEAATLVARVALRDNRRTDGFTDRSWHEDLQDLELDDCVEAVGQHFRHSTEWITTAHVRTRVVAIRKARHDQAGYPDFPPDLTDDQERTFRRVWLAAVGSGSSRDQATAIADRQLGVTREIGRPRPVAQLLAGSGFGKRISA